VCGRVAERCMGVSVTKAATPAAARARRLCGDLVSGRVQREPCGAEGGHALSIGFARFLILREEVQRVTVIGELGRPFGARGRAQKRGVDTATTVGLPVTSSGGHALAHAPVQALLVPWSALNRYRVRPCELTRIWPIPVFEMPTVAA
jgi:hypothetical protein